MRPGREVTIVAIDPETLATAYKQLYEAIDGKTTDEAVKTIWSEYGSQVLALPDHLFNREQVRKVITEQVKNGEEIDPMAASKEWGYSRRWIRDVIKRAQE